MNMVRPQRQFCSPPGPWRRFAQINRFQFWKDHLLFPGHAQNVPEAQRNDFFTKQPNLVLKDFAQQWVLYFYGEWFQRFDPFIFMKWVLSAWWNWCIFCFLASVSLCQGHKKAHCLQLSFVSNQPEQFRHQESEKKTFKVSFPGLALNSSSADQFSPSFWGMHTRMKTLKK